MIRAVPLGLRRHIMPLTFAFVGRFAGSIGPATIPCLTQSATASVTCAPCSMALEALELVVGCLNCPRQPISAPFSRSLQTAASRSLSLQPTALAQDFKRTAETGAVPVCSELAGNSLQKCESAGLL